VSWAASMTPKPRLSSANRRPPANDLLAAVPADDYARLAPTLGTTPLKLKRFLHKPGERIDQVYFPGGGFASVVTVLKDGSMVEVATIGREGMIGMSAALNRDPSPSATMVQAETDTCYTMSAEAFRQEMDRRGTFYDLVTRYGQAFVGVIMQSTVQRCPLRRTTAGAVVIAGT
jgi:CRP-like cAMP-binding protein